MPNNTARKRKEAAFAAANPTPEELAAAGQAERAAAALFARAMLAGALVALLTLVASRFGFAELWSRHPDAASPLLGRLALSALLGGAAAAWAGRGSAAPVPAGACALGWALCAVWQHVVAAGTFLATPAPGIPSLRHDLPHLRDVMPLSPAAMQRELPVLFIAMCTIHPLCVLAAVTVATIAGHAVRVRVLRGSSEPGDTETQQAQAQGVAQVPPRAQAAVVAQMAFSILFTALALLLLWVLGWIPQRAGTPTSLPTMTPYAVLAAVVTLISFGVSGFALAGRFRRAGNAAYLAAAPLAVLVVSLLISGRHHLLLPPLLAVFLNCSPFEVCCWGVCGAVVGKWLREVSSA